MIDFSQYTKANIEASMLNQVDDDFDKREGCDTYSNCVP